MTAAIIPLLQQHDESIATLLSLNKLLRGTIGKLLFLCAYFWVGLMKFRLFVIAIILLTGACSNSTPPPAQNPPSSAKTETPKQEPTVLDNQLKALDKAKALEVELQKQKEERDKQIEAAEQGK